MEAKKNSDIARANLRENRSRSTTMLAIYFFIALIIPNCILAVTETYSVWSEEALLLLPLGFYMMWSVALRRSGIMVWLGFPFIFLGAFQIVLSYLFGNSIIATDMFTNVLTTNPGEAGELLSNIYPSVIAVGVLYLPLLWLATREIGHKRYLSHTARKNIGLLGATLFGIGALTLVPAYRASDNPHLFRDEIFPANVCYNIKLSASEFRKSHRFNETSANFTYDAERTDSAAKREIYVYVIGEASRAASWQLYGYGRETTPRLSATPDLVVFRDILTQSNTTHKSVPLILSSVATHQHEELYRRKGLPALFNEAGFETWFISNQAPQGAMIDHLAEDAHHVEYLSAPRHDGQLLEAMRQAIEADTTHQRLLFILHCYGSHFSYHQRYPRDFAVFQPDDDVAIVAKHAECLRNAYDNSVYYTDHFLSETIEYLRGLDACSALLYCADHGEDLFDDERGRFLHASPTTTYYQLHVASLAWFSQAYCDTFPAKVEAARSNVTAPATTHALFHTMADMASVTGNCLDWSVSLVSPQFDRSAPRFYLSDHNEAVPYAQTGLTDHDRRQFELRGIEP